MKVRALPRSQWAHQRAASGTRATTKTHDLGGQDALLDTLPPQDASLKKWELDTHALFATLAKKGFFSTDEARRACRLLREYRRRHGAVPLIWSDGLAELAYKWLEFVKKGPVVDGLPNLRRPGPDAAEVQQ